MKPSDLEDLLNVLDKHPRVTSVHFAPHGEVSLTLGEYLVPVTEGTKEDEDPESLELPKGVPDPRDRIREIYRKHNLARDGKVPS